MRLQRIDGGVGSVLDDGSRALLVQAANRGIVGVSRQGTMAPVWGPADAGDLVIAWWGTTTATDVAPTAADLRVPSDWRLVKVVRAFEERSVYPARFSWLVFVAARLSSAQASAPSWVLGEQDTRGLPVIIGAQVSKTVPPQVWPWWRPQAWALKGLASIVDVTSQADAAAPTHASPPRTVLPESDPAPGVLWTWAADWQTVGLSPLRWIDGFAVNPLQGQEGARDGTDLPFNYSWANGDDDSLVVPVSWVTGGPYSWAGHTVSGASTSHSGDPVSVSVAAVPVTGSLSSHADVPMPPEITSLQSGWADGRAGHDLAWIYHPGVASAQTAWCLRRVSDGATAYWDAEAASWVTNPAWNLSSLQTATLPPEAVQNGSHGTYSLRTRAGGTVGSAWSTPIDVVWTDPPQVSVSVVGADGGGVVADQTPTIMTSAIPGGGAQILGWEAEVRTSSGVLLLSTSGDGPSAWTLVEPLENDVTYIARARVKQSGDMWSDWASAIFTVRATPPGTPTVTVTPTTHAVSGMPGLEVTATFPDDGFPFESTPVSARVQRSVNDGASWETVAVVAMPPGVRSVVVRDWMAPPMQPVLYRARGEARDVDGGSMWGGWGVSAAATLTVEGGWLSVVGDPSRAVRLRLVEEDTREIDLRASEHAPIGSPEWVVTGGVPMDETGGLTVGAWNAGEVAAIRTLLTSGEMLRVTFCPEIDVTSMRTREAVQALTFRVAKGSVQVSRLVQGPYAIRHVAFSWVAARPKPWADPVGTA